MSSEPTKSLAVMRWSGDWDLEPRKGYRGDAGLDLITSEETVVEPGSFVDVDCGIQIELPEGLWGYLTGRSSTLRKRGLLVNPGVIDNGYRGAIFVGVWNMGQGGVTIERGERIAQLIMHKVETDFVLERVLAVGHSERGPAGFGSTGA